jgi:hypothetical protein
MGIDPALLFSSLGNRLLAAIGLAAALYHVMNHAHFKGLLILGTGSVLHRTRKTSKNYFDAAAETVNTSSEQRKLSLTLRSGAKTDGNCPPKKLFFTQSISAIPFPTPSIVTLLFPSCLYLLPCKEIRATRPNNEITDYRPFTCPLSFFSFSSCCLTPQKQTIPISLR